MLKNLRWREIFLYDIDVSFEDRFYCIHLYYITLPPPPPNQ